MLPSMVPQRVRYDWVTEQQQQQQQHTHTHTHTHIYNRLLLSHKKWPFAICSDMGGLGWYYAKWNKSDQVRQIL